MFELGAAYNHLMRLEDLIRGWVDFAQEEPGRRRWSQREAAGARQLPRSAA
jgi:hypothetical protein